LISLPNIILEAAKRLGETKKELLSLPPVIEQPETYLLMLISRLSEVFQSYVRGGFEHSELLHQNRSAYDTFKVAIRNTKPHFIPVPDKKRKDSIDENLEGAVGLADVEEAKLIDLNDVREHIHR
jgi:hypothetical protein